MNSIEELIAAAAVCAGERRINRRLVAAVAAVYPELATDADTARREGQMAARLIIGRGAPAPITAADRVWVRLDVDHGPAITRAALDRAAMRNT